VNENFCSISSNDDDNIDSDSDNDDDDDDDVDCILENNGVVVAINAAAFGIITRSGDTPPVTKKTIIQLREQLLSCLISIRIPSSILVYLVVVCVDYG
jgi:hypothetical protein